MGSNYKLGYSVDLCLCIDTTMSMDHILDIVKKNALNLYDDIQRKMREKQKKIDSLRVRIVAFRDYYYDREKAMMITDFFNLPEQAAEFETAVKSMTADGGGDDPEDGLEALAYAMKSKWNNQTEKKRHAIIVWSDDATHDLGFGKEAANYPKGMAKDFNELTEWWGSPGNPGIMDEKAKRLVIFAPPLNSWTKIRDNWNNVVHYESDAGDGLRNLDYERILDMIAGTING